MKHFIFLILAATFFTSCAEYYQGLYDIQLNEVQPPINLNEENRISKINSVLDKGIKKYIHEDSLLKATWFISNFEFTLMIENKTEHPIKIKWYEAVYENELGISSKIITDGASYIDRNNHQIFSKIIPKSKIINQLFPVENIRQGSTGMEIEPFFIFQALSPDELRLKSSLHIGKKMKILLPIQIEENTYEYLYIFYVNNFKVLPSTLETFDTKGTKKLN